MSTTNRRVGCGASRAEAAGATAGASAKRASAIREAHPPEHISGDREREHGRPDIDVERVEPRRRRGHPSERADPQGVEAEDQRESGAAPGKSHSPVRGIGKNGGQAECGRVGAAAGERDFNWKRRRAEQPRRNPCLSLGHRQEGMRFGPVQRSRPKRPRLHATPRSANLTRVREPTSGRCPSARGISCTVTCWAPKDRRSSSIASRLLSLGRAGKDVDVHRARFPATCGGRRATR